MPLKYISKLTIHTITNPANACTFATCHCWRGIWKRSHRTSQYAPPRSAAATEKKAAFRPPFYHL